MKTIDYWISDPLAMNFRKNVSPPENQTQMKYQVRGYKGGGYPRNSQQGRAANTYVSITNALNWVNKQFPKALNRWPGASTLWVLPEAGQDLNAFYDRRSIQLFFAPHPNNSGLVYACNSGDVVTHELGHAILDTLRPDTWSAASLEVWAYHEAFADTIAMLSMLQHQEVLDLVARRGVANPNMVNKVAEQLGNCIYFYTRGNRPKNYLRLLLNNFKYQKPESLPEDAPYNKLAGESHSFGRLFAAAYYDMFVGIYRYGRAKQWDEYKSLCYARDYLSKYFLLASHKAPLNVRFYQSVGNALIWAANNEPGRPHLNIISDVLARRKIVSKNVKHLSAKDAPICSNPEGIEVTHNARTIRLSDHFLRSQSDPDLQKLYDAEIEVPQESGYLYDRRNRRLMQSVAITDYETIQAAQGFVNFLHKTGKVSDDPTTPFEISNGKLVRTYFS